MVEVIYLLVNLNKEHIKNLNGAVSILNAELQNDYSKGQISNRIIMEKMNRCEYFRETLHLVGNISINEVDYNLIKDYMFDESSK
jgi:hypothetical protein